ncbi:unnamed protein product, partial [Urochloa humidicola]
NPHSKRRPPPAPSPPVFPLSRAAGTSRDLWPAPPSPSAQLRPAPPFLAGAAPARAPVPCRRSFGRCPRSSPSQLLPVARVPGASPDLQAAAVPALPLSQTNSGGTSPSLSSRPDPSRTPPTAPRTVSSPPLSPLWQRRPAPPLAAEDRTHIALPLIQIQHETSRRRLTQIRQDRWIDGPDDVNRMVRAHDEHGTKICLLYLVSTYEYQDSDEVNIDPSEYGVDADEASNPNVLQNTNTGIRQSGDEEHLPGGGDNR